MDTDKNGRPRSLFLSLWEWSGGILALAATYLLLHLFGNPAGTALPFLILYGIIPFFLGIWGAEKLAARVQREMNRTHPK